MFSLAGSENPSLLPGQAPMERINSSAETPPNLLGYEGAMDEKFSCYSSLFISPPRFWGFDVSPPGRNTYLRRKLREKKAHTITSRITEDFLAVSGFFVTLFGVPPEKKDPISV